jgi:hypothetical protein
VPSIELNSQQIMESDGKEAFFDAHPETPKETCDTPPAPPRPDERAPGPNSSLLAWPLVVTAVPTVPLVGLNPKIERRFNRKGDLVARCPPTGDDNITSRGIGRHADSNAGVGSGGRTLPGVALALIPLVNASHLVLVSRATHERENVSTVTTETSAHFNLRVALNACASRDKPATELRNV